MPSKRGRKSSNHRKIMLVEGNPAIGGRVAETISARGHKVVWAETAAEATRLLQDAVYIGSSFDALLADYHLSDASALRVIRDFRTEFKSAPVGLMAHQNDIATAIWANSKGIPVLEKPIREPELIHWLSHVERIPNAGSLEAVPA